MGNGSALFSFFQQLFDTLPDGKLRDVHLFSTIFQKETTFMMFRLLSWTTNLSSAGILLRERICSKNKLFPVKVDLYLKTKVRLVVGVLG